MSTMSYYINDVLDKYSGVQALSMGAAGSRLAKIDTAGNVATGQVMQISPGLIATHTSADSCDTATGQRLSSGYLIHRLGTGAFAYMLPYPYPGMRVIIDAQRSSDVAIWSGIGSGTTPVTMIWASATGYTCIAGTGAGPKYFDFIGYSTAAWYLMNNTTAGTTGGTGTTCGP